MTGICAPLAHQPAAFLQLRVNLSAVNWMHLRIMKTILALFKKVSMQKFYLYSVDLSSPDNEQHLIFHCVFFPKWVKIGQKFQRAKTDFHQ